MGCSWLELNRLCFQFQGQLQWPAQSIQKQIFKGVAAFNAPQAACSFGDSSRMLSRNPVQASSKRSSTCSVVRVPEKLLLRQSQIAALTVSHQLKACLATKVWIWDLQRRSGEPQCTCNSASQLDPHHKPHLVILLVLWIPDEPAHLFQLQHHSVSCLALARRLAHAPVLATLAFVPQPLGIWAP